MHNLPSVERSVDTSEAEKNAHVCILHATLSVLCYYNMLYVCGMALWLERRSLTGELSLIYV